MVKREIREQRRSDKVRRQFRKMRRQRVALDKRTSEMLARMYIARRIDYQIEYYETRVKQNESKSDQFFRFGAVVITASSLFAALNTQSPSPELNMLITALPAVAALLASFQQLYQWDRQASLYRDTIFGLEEARMLIPDMDQYTAEKAHEMFPQLVSSAEKVFEDEVNQWGQLAKGQDVEDDDFDPLEAIAEQYGLDIFGENGDVDESKVGQLGDILSAARSGDINSVAEVLSIQTEGAGQAVFTRTTELEDDGTVAGTTTTVNIDEPVADALDDVGYMDGTADDGMGSVAYTEAMSVPMDAMPASMPADEDVFYEEGAAELDLDYEADSLVSDDYGPTDEDVFYEEGAAELDLDYEANSLVSDDYGPTDEDVFYEEGAAELDLDYEAESLVPDDYMDSDDIDGPTMAGEQDIMMNENGASENGYSESSEMDDEDMTEDDAVEDTEVEIVAEIETEIEGEVEDEDIPG